MAYVHRSVLLDEVVELLRPAPGRRFVDCTLGGGGHSEALLEAGAEVVGFDRDPVAIAAASERLARFGARFRAVNARFSQIRAHVGAPVDGLVADLGVSSPQLDEAARGFSFQRDGDLSMKMGGEGPSAADLVNTLGEAELAQILKELGEEPQARRVARAIVAARPFARTLQLADVVAKALGGVRGRVHPATRTFQALRIAVNDELGELDSLLAAVPEMLVEGGRAAIISFHSLEDRRVKHAFRELAGIGAPVDPYGHPLVVPWGTLVTRKAVESSDDNPRARSARLRVIERRVHASA